ncbi:hypothetical protein IDH32_05140 [Pelagibacterales bacterium SAG-MED01]|nr:hypothetical protein [Pelagibacterales bacterium SAG-MED01]
MKNEPVVCYLFTSFDEHSSLKNFIINYKNYKSGINHKLVICFKLFKNHEIKELKNFLINLEYTSFIDPITINDFDFGSYKRVAEKYPQNQILFLNSHSYPICENWLLKLINYSNDNTLIGTSASNESILDSIILKKKYKIISHIFKKVYLKKRFQVFPNPHIRTSSFLLYGEKFLDYMNNKKIVSKQDTWEIESGKNSLFNHFKDNNYNVYIINSDGNKFEEKDWKLSETYNYFKQSKSIISDKHTRKYEALDDSDKFLSRMKVWG